MAATYDLISEQVLSSAAASVTFSNIPQGFKDLVLEITGTASSSAWGALVQFNGDTGSNYSMTWITGNGSTASSGRQSNVTSLNILADMNSTVATGSLAIMSYANTSVFKTCLGRKANSSFESLAGVGLWRSTSAITSILLFASATYAAGTTVRLWGVVG